MRRLATTAFSDELDRPLGLRRDRNPTLGIDHGQSRTVVLRFLTEGVAPQIEGGKRQPVLAFSWRRVVAGFGHVHGTKKKSGGATAENALGFDSMTDGNRPCQAEAARRIACDDATGTCQALRGLASRSSEDFEKLDVGDRLLHLPRLQFPSNLQRLQSRQQVRTGRALLQLDCFNRFLGLLLGQLQLLRDQLRSPLAGGPLGLRQSNFVGDLSTSHLRQGTALFSPRTDVASLFTAQTKQRLFARYRGAQPESRLQQSHQ